MSRHDADLDALIRSARNERPANGWQGQRTAFRRLGLGGGAALLLARVSYAFPLLLRAPRWMLGAAGVVAAAGVAGSMFRAPSASLDERAQTAPLIETAPLAAAEQPPRARAEVPPIPMMSVDALPAAPRRVQVPPTPARAATAREAEDLLAKETASISRIRARLAVRDFASALARVREHRATFPGGLFEQEVTVLEIEAQQGLGDHATACAQGRAFLDAHPSSPHRTRVAGLTRSCSH